MIINNDSESLEVFRKDFPSLGRTRAGLRPIYFDNACTTLVPRPVIDALDEYYTDYPACGGRRSHHWFAAETSRRIEGGADNGTPGSRRRIASFIQARSEKEIVFTPNTTHAINIVALGFPFRPGDVVISTDREHNSNLLPWLRLQKEGHIRLEHMSANPEEVFDLDAFEHRLKQGGVRLVSMAYTSNMTGYTLPARDIVCLAHQHGARVLLDGAQTVPHRKVNVQDLDVDFLAFSLHKMCGTRGIGVLYAKEELLDGTAWPDSVDILEPVILGGGTVSDTTYDSYSLLGPPEKYEAGIPDYAGQIAASAAIRYLTDIGMERISAWEYQLNRLLTEELLCRYGDSGWFEILGPTDPAQRGGILSFVVRRPNAIGIAAELDRKRNIMIRDGVFCVHSFFNERYGSGWLRPRSHHEHRMIYRVSLYLYNTPDECSAFVETLNEIFQERSYI